MPEAIGKVFKPSTLWAMNPLNLPNYQPTVQFNRVLSKQSLPWKTKCEQVVCESLAL